MSALDFGILLKARGRLRILHHIPGRVRLRFSPEILTAVPELRGTQKADVLASLRGVRDVQINLLAFSLELSYDPRAIPPGSWERLIHGTEEEATAVVEELRQPMGGA